MYLEPTTGFRCGLKCVGQSTVTIETGGGRITGAVTFTSRLDPDNRIDQGRSCVESGTCSEASTFDVAPISPLLTNVLDTRTSLVDDEVGREGSQQRCKGL